MKNFSKVKIVCVMMACMLLFTLALSGCDGAGSGSSDNTCSYCHGTGNCASCNGKGFVGTRTCTACRGRGICMKCGGDGNYNGN
jgi:hypothetical protein